MKIKKVLSTIIMAAVMSLSACNSAETAQTTPTAASTTTAAATTTTTLAEETTEEKPHKGFYVDGTKLYDANGNEFIFRGINHAHTWFKDQLNTAIPAIADTGSNTVRIVLSNGYQWSKDSLESIKEIIEICKKNELIAIVEVHDGTGKDDPKILEGIVDYWIEMKDALIGNEAYVILNIANEWYGTWGDTEWADAYKKAIPRIREAGIENLIMVDSAGWGQYPMSIAKCGVEVFESDPLRNTMFSIHMYGSAGKNEKVIKRNIDNVLKQNLCVCIGEFGFNHSDGDVDEEYIMSYCTEIGVGYLGWSWKGNGGGVEYLDMAIEWDGSVISADWGATIICGEHGIKETSEKCSVFE